MPELGRIGPKKPEFALLTGTWNASPTIAHLSHCADLSFSLCPTQLHTPHVLLLPGHPHGFGQAKVTKASIITRSQLGVRVCSAFTRRRSGDLKKLLIIRATSGSNPRGQPEAVSNQKSHVRTTCTAFADVLHRTRGGFAGYPCNRLNEANSKGKSSVSSPTANTTR